MALQPQVTLASLGRHHPNQDTALVRPEYGLFAVFDGVGGRQMGDEASRRAAGAYDLFYSLRARKITTVAKAEKSARLAVKAAHGAVYDFNHTQDPITKASTTVAALHYLPDLRHVVAVSYGDSRAYRWRNDVLEQLTVDNSTARTPDLHELHAQQVFEGDISADDTVAANRYLRTRHYVQYILGGHTPRIIPPKTQSCETASGDIYLLTTDGVHDNLTTLEIAELLRKFGDSDELAQAIVAAAFDRSRSDHVRAKPDDITAISVALPA